MRAIRVHETGAAAEVLRPEDLPRPEPGEGQALVRVVFAAVVRGDVVVRSGGYPFPLPFVPGLEVVGQVVAVGAGVDPGRVGESVVAATAGMSGGYAEYAVVDAVRAHRIPGGVTAEQALAVAEPGGLAYGILDVIGLRAGESVLVTAAAGRAGSMLVQVARAAGAIVVAGVGAEAKRPAALESGAVAAVDYSADGWEERVREVSGGAGVDAVLDSVGGEIGRQALAAARDGGRIGVFGFSSGRWAPLDAFAIGRRGLTVVGVLGLAFARAQAQQEGDVARALKDAAAGRLVGRVHSVHPLEEAARAHEVLERRENVGVVLLRTGVDS
ncbi:NADPH2:quinone reductase [Streptacidiphilus sp. MAP12-33]|uniref:zinc-binding dehydrogenase n=1 Tax=Streptacidiphilus sp. MAP12-33 TaxID=3156266 RepID=UPI003517E70F